MGDRVIGTAAAERRPIRVNDMSRVRRFASAIRSSAAEENRTHAIQLPGLPHVMSQIALPMIAHGALRGVLYLESARRMTFSRNDHAALAIIAAQVAGAITHSESEAAESAAAPASPPGTPPEGRPFRVVHPCL